MNCLLFLFAVLVGVAWGQGALRLALPVTVATATAQPQRTPSLLIPCMASKAVIQAEEELDNPEDQKYNISEAESQELLTALEAEGIGRNESLLQARNAEFAAPAMRRALIKWPCPSFNSYCPYRWQRLRTVRHNGPCGAEYCRPLPWFSTYYAVCSCTSCNRGWSRCLPSNYRTRVLLAFCFHPHLRWNIRAVRVTLPQSCACRRMCRG